MEKDTLQPTASLKDESQLVTFLLKDEEFGFDIMTVQEIIRLPKMAKVPRTPAYVDGIVDQECPAGRRYAHALRHGAPRTDRTRHWWSTSTASRPACAWIASTRWLACYAARLKHHRRRFADFLTHLEGIELDNGNGS